MRLMGGGDCLVASIAPQPARGWAEASRPDQRRARVVADGKHLSAGGTPFRIRGVTYGSFATRSDGEAFPNPDRVRSDFAMMAAAGLNNVRTYNTPPADVLELAEEAGLWVLLG